MTLSDGNVITVTGTSAADKHWIQVKATKDAALTAKDAGPCLRGGGLPV